jgi:hypothetical protein
MRWRLVGPFAARARGKAGVATLDALAGAEDGRACRVGEGRGSPPGSAGRTLMATLRSSRVSRARQTSPMPPAPIGATIS